LLLPERNSHHVHTYVHTYVQETDYPGLDPSGSFRT
jgi:hypothetical protein